MSYAREEFICKPEQLIKKTDKAANPAAGESFRCCDCAAALAGLNMRQAVESEATARDGEIIDRFTLRNVRELQRNRHLSLLRRFHM